MRRDLLATSGERWNALLAPEDAASPRPCAPSITSLKSGFFVIKSSSPNKSSSRIWSSAEPDRCASPTFSFRFQFDSLGLYANVSRRLVLTRQRGDRRALVPLDRENRKFSDRHPNLSPRVALAGYR